jgi:hypothetical protein
MISELFLQSRTEQALRAARQEVEIIGSLLRVSGTVELQGFRRVSDYVTHQAEALTLRDATLLNRKGMPTADRLPRLVVHMPDMTLVGQRFVFHPDPSDEEQRIEKVRRRIAALTSGHYVEGTVSLYPGADLLAVLQATDPPFLPLLDVRLRWLTDRRLKSRFEFALLNRRQIVAVAPLDEAQ